MTVEIQKSKTNRRFTGYSYENKPELTEEDVGDLFFELDTKNKFEWMGADWVKTHEEGSLARHEEDYHTSAESLEYMHEYVDQLKILNSYMLLITGEHITVDDLEEE